MLGGFERVGWKNKIIKLNYDAKNYTSTSETEESVAK